MDTEVCSINYIHKDKVERSKTRLATGKLDELCSIFKALAENNRLKIVYALSFEDELCVCDISTIIEASVATTSHHLQLLKKLDIVAHRKEGKMVFYFLKDKALIRPLIMGH